ncbi:MAG: hypothetical protein ACHQ51_09510 [Elusimicrobiota bacterium]
MRLVHRRNMVGDGKLAPRKQVQDAQASLIAKRAKRPIKREHIQLGEYVTKKPCGVAKSAFSDRICYTRFQDHKVVVVNRVDSGTASDGTVKKIPRQKRVKLITLRSLVQIQPPQPISKFVFEPETRNVRTCTHRKVGFVFLGTESPSGACYNIRA